MWLVWLFASPLISETMNHQGLLWNVHCAPQKPFFFITNWSQNIICKFIFVRKVNEMTFSAKPTLCKECNQKCWLGSNISLSHIGRNKIYSFPIQPRHVFKSMVSNHVAMGRTWFIIYPWFFFFVSRGLDLHSAILKIAVNHATWDVYSLKAFETSHTDSVMDITFFIVGNVYFLLVLWKLSIRRE